MILGDSGKDTLYGDAGDDTINGGEGDDTLAGGTGSDTFVFGPDTGNDTITDFDAANDTIDLSTLPEALAFSDLTFTALDDGTGTVITHDALGGSITVLGLDPEDFIEEMFNLPDGMTTAVDAGHERSVSLWSNPWEGTDRSETMSDGGSATRIVAMGGDDVVLAAKATTCSRVARATTR